MVWQATRRPTHGTGAKARADAASDCPQVCARKPKNAIAGPRDRYRKLTGGTAGAAPSPRGTAQAAGETEARGGLTDADGLIPYRQSSSLGTRPRDL